MTIQIRFANSVLRTAPSPTPFSVAAVIHHYTDDDDRGLVGAEGFMVLIEGDQFEAGLAVLVFAARPVFLEGGFVAAITGHHVVTRTGASSGSMMMRSPSLNSGDIRATRTEAIM